MANMVSLTCEALDMDRLCDQADIVMMALPHKLPMALVPELLKRGKSVIDLSADFRFQHVDRYEAAYQPHTARELLAQAVYGLSEVYTDRIKTATLVGNPGCYPTSVLLPLVPLLKRGLIEPHSIIADAKSGVSGAGRSPSLTTHFCEVNESFKAYKVAVHRHNPEMNEILSLEAGQSIAITFVPHLVPMTRGMLTTLYAVPQASAEPEDIRECWEAFYSGRPFVRICPDERLPDTRYVIGTNFCDIGFRLDTAGNHLILISAIDNLVKGAAGQAVQNMNIMLGLDETTGLWTMPGPV
jgi:N-acetyl-gamma-glutamyl-phosphate reductase